MGEIIIDSNNYLTYQETPWDSNVLGYKSNEIVCIKYSNESQLNKIIDKFEAFCLSQKYFFTNARINPDDQILRKSLSNMDYLNSETSLLVERGVKNFNPINVGKLKFTLRNYNPQDMNDLKSISYEIFNHGRFFEDPFISNENARIRNKNWINDLIVSSIIIVGEINATIFGFMAFKIDDNKVTLQLGGVKLNYSVYAYPFWSEVIKYLINEQNAKHISGIISASNIRIINLYSFFEFKFTDVYFGYHKHRKKI